METENGLRSHRVRNKTIIPSRDKVCEINKVKTKGGKTLGRDLKDRKKG